jgi:hypothetical protein
MLERQVVSCGSAMLRLSGLFEMPTAVMRYRSLALHWLSETLAFNSRMKDTIGRCIVDDIAQRPCEKDKTHLWFTETGGQCKADLPHAHDEYLGSAPMFQLELAARHLPSSVESWKAWWSLDKVLDRHSVKGANSC